MLGRQTTQEREGAGVGAAGVGSVGDRLRQFLQFALMFILQKVISHQCFQITAASGICFHDTPEKASKGDLEGVHRDAILMRRAETVYPSEQAGL